MMMPSPSNLVNDAQVVLFYNIVNVYYAFTRRLLILIIQAISHLLILLVI